MPLRRILAVLLLFACTPATAQQAAPPGPTPAARAAARFPQPVRVGDLIRRQVLRPVEQQDVLGRVAGVVRRPDGAVLVVVNLGGVLGFGTRPVAVPVEAVALLGGHPAGAAGRDDPRGPDPAVPLTGGPSRTLLCRPPFTLAALRPVRIHETVQATPAPSRGCGSPGRDPLARAA